MVSREIDGVEENNDIQNQKNLPTTGTEETGSTIEGLASDPLEKTKGIIDGLLGDSCEIPMWEVSDLAKDAGINMSEILGWAEKRETCFVDWDTGHIRCTEPGEDDGK